MHRITACLVLVLAVGCAAPTPTATPQPTPSPTTQPSPTPTPTPTSTPSPTVSPPPTPTPDQAATLSRLVLRELEDWTPVCTDVPLVDCYGVAALFVNNLARNWQWVHEQSDGIVTVTQRPTCPDFGDTFGGTQDPSFCWQASAAVADGRVCMVVARQTHPIMGFEFGQVGGDEMAGLAVPPGHTPRNPCI